MEVILSVEYLQYATDALPFGEGVVVQKGKIEPIAF